METTDFLFTVPQPFKWTQRNFFGISNLQLYVILIMDDTTPYRLDYFQMFVILAIDDTIPIEILDNSFRDISGSSIRKFTKFGLEKIPEYRNYKDIRYRIAKNIEYRFFFLLYHP
uniref:Uncharacterized protein n=1 Tax=Cacopsylla melanoneura TaxID=428564 RepID=A0A8D8SX84_9HEMI